MQRIVAGKLKQDRRRRRSRWAHAWRAGSRAISAARRRGSAVRLGMEVIAWRQNLTADRAAEAGAVLVDEGRGTVLAGRYRPDLFGAELPNARAHRRQRTCARKPTARLVNTSRGPIVVEADLLAALRNGKIAGAGIDVFDQEPLPHDHPFRSQANLLATPHIGYVSRGLYTRFYQDTVDNIRQWLDAREES